MLRLALFDCDGTLVDSQHVIVAAMTEAFLAADLPPPPPDAVRRVVGLSLVDAVAHLLPEAGRERHEALARAYKDAFAARRVDPDHEEPLFPGCREALDALEAEGVLLGVATGKSRRGLLLTLERHGLLGRFVTLQTADQGPGKPHPAMVERALAETGARAEDTVVVGDTTFDVLMARNARAASIGVSWGYHDVAELKAAGADHIVDAYAEVPPTALRLLARTSEPERNA